MTFYRPFTDNPSMIDTQYKSTVYRYYSLVLVTSRHTSHTSHHHFHHSTMCVCKCVCMYTWHSYIYSSKRVLPSSRKATWIAIAREVSSLTTLIASHVRIPFASLAFGARSRHRHSNPTIANLSR